MKRPLIFSEHEADDGSWYWSAYRNGRNVGESRGYLNQTNARRAHRELRDAIRYGTLVLEERSDGTRVAV